MKFRPNIIAIISFPLLVVLVLSVSGITLGFWFYFIMFAGCLVSAGISWSISRKTEEKVKKAGKGDPPPDSR